METNTRLLTLSVNAWDNSVCTGNTFTNFFGKFDKSDVANIFCRNEKPDNLICGRYFKITERDIFLNIFLGMGVGFVYKPEDGSDNSSNNNEYSHFKWFKPTLLLFLREWLWSIGSWKNERLDQFLFEFKPDVIYMHGHMGYYMHKLLAYCQVKTGAKVVLFFGDDMYSYKTYNPMKNLYQFFMRKWLNKSILIADLLYGGSKPLCTEYNNMFNKRFNLLYKGCDLTGSIIKEKYHNPIIITYTGNLNYGRWEALTKLVNEIETVNKESVKFKLNIFTQTQLRDSISKALNRGESSKVFGKISYEKVKSVLSNSDIVLHVESFSKEQRKITRLSFSTKIIDCMQSGSCIMAIGPKDVASIQYLIETNSALVVTEKNGIRMLLSNILENKSCIVEYAIKMNKYAKIHHDINLVQREVLKNIMSIIP